MLVPREVGADRGNGLKVEVFSADPCSYHLVDFDAIEVDQQGVRWCHGMCVGVCGVLVV